ncbi:MAG: ABC transporter substrate-binding protein [Micropruina sp.]|nr:ABC transporter substrate-binding protein [Micropruina sp.]
MHRRTFLATALALAAAGCTTGQQPAATTPSGSAAARATIGLSYIPNVQFAPFYLAEADALYGSVPAQVTLRHHGATEGLFNALTSGAEDFLVAAGSEALQARAEGVDVIAVGAYYKQFPVDVLTLGSSPVKSLKDLKGRSLGVPGRFGESWLGAQVALATAGLTDKDVTIVEVGYTQVAALTTKKVDAVVGFRTNELVQLRADGADPRVLPVAAGTVPLVSTCLLTTAAYAQANPDVVRQVVAATAKAIEATAADPGRAVDESAKVIPGWTAASRPNAEQVLAATVELMGVTGGRFDPGLDEAQWGEMGQFLQRADLLPASVSAAEAFTNTYSR